MEAEPPPRKQRLRKTLGGKPDLQAFPILARRLAGNKPALEFVVPSPWCRACVAVKNFSAWRSALMKPCAVNLYALRWRRGQRLTLAKRLQVLDSRVESEHLFFPPPSFLLSTY